MINDALWQMKVASRHSRHVLQRKQIAFGGSYKGKYEDLGRLESCVRH